MHQANYFRDLYNAHNELAAHMVRARQNIAFYIETCIFRHYHNFTIIPHWKWTIHNHDLKRCSRWSWWLLTNSVGGSCSWLIQIETSCVHLISGFHYTLLSSSRNR